MAGDYDILPPVQTERDAKESNRLQLANLRRDVSMVELCLLGVFLVLGYQSCEAVRLKKRVDAMDARPAAAAPPRPSPATPR